MQAIIQQVEQAHRKKALPLVQSGDSVRVHQAIREGNKKRIQIFHGVVVRTHRPSELTANITVRRIASGVGVEKTFLLHSPNVTKVEVIRRGKVRRNFLSYLRGRRGKSARLQELSFDRTAANVSASFETGEDEAVPQQPQAQDDRQAKTDEQRDAEITELPEEDISVPADVSTEDVAKDENKAAAAEDGVSLAEDPEGGDEEQLSADEVDSGTDRANNEDSRAQRPVSSQ
jgi:large subunit ribosomal protein L19